LVDHYNGDSDCYVSGEDHLPVPLGYLTFLFKLNLYQKDLQRKTLILIFQHFDFWFHEKSGSFKSY